MTGLESRIERILSNPDVVPFEGPDADKIFKEVCSRIEMASTTEELVRRAVKSLASFNYAETIELARIQGALCKRCGNCCRLSTPIDFRKEELRAVAKRLGISYKKLKKKLHAYPTGIRPVIAVPGKPCPFLEGRNVCTIYDLRPIVCELYPLGRTLSAMLTGKVVKLVNFRECPAIEDVMVTLAISRIIQEQSVVSKHEAV